jgi:hypothetical protein
MWSDDVMASFNMHWHMSEGTEENQEHLYG